MNKSTLSEAIYSVLEILPPELVRKIKSVADGRVGGLGDIKELRIVKELTSLGTYRYTAATNEVGGSFSARLNTIFRECVTGFDYAQNIIVIKTSSTSGSNICKVLN